MYIYIYVLKRLFSVNFVFESVGKQFKTTHMLFLPIQWPEQ